MSKKRELTAKQKLFADYYIISLNQTDAAKKAGYSPKTAKSTGSELMQKDHVREYIDARLAERESELIADQKEILEFLTSVMRGNITEPITVLDGDGYQKVVDVKPNAATRKSAAELLGKRHAMWIDNKQMSGNVGVMMIIDDTGDDED